MILILLCILCFSIYLFFPKPKKKLKSSYDAIVILGCPAHDDGTVSLPLKERCNFALQLYEQGKAPLIIVSGAAVQNRYAEAQVMKQYLMLCNHSIPVQMELQARNTYQNLKFVKETFACKQILVVTSPSHIRRACFFTKKFFYDSDVVKCKYHDSIKQYILEYTRLWVCLYYEIKLSIQKTT